MLGSLRRLDKIVNIGIKRHFETKGNIEYVLNTTVISPRPQNFASLFF